MRGARLTTNELRLPHSLSAVRSIADVKILIAVLFPQHDSIASNLAPCLLQHETRRRGLNLEEPMRLGGDLKTEGE